MQSPCGARDTPPHAWPMAWTIPTIELENATPARSEAFAIASLASLSLPSLTALGRYCLMRLIAVKAYASLKGFFCMHV